MRADRLLSLMMLLQARGKMTAQALAEELEVSRRTILRDVDALSFAGIPIYTDGGHGGGITLDENYRVKLNGLNEAEVHALVLSSNASLLADVGLGDAADNSLLKLFTALPSLHEQAARDIQNRIYIDPIWWWHSRQKLDFLGELQRAVYDDRLIQIIYEKHDGAVIDRIVAPYGLVSKASVWYLIASHEGQFRSYRVSRLDNITVIDKQFTRDTNFDLAEHWQASIQGFMTDLKQYTFTLRVQNTKRNIVKWYALGTYEIVETSDEGWFIAHFETESMELAVMFVFGLGVDVEVIEPQDLADTVLQRSRLIAEHKER